jgi:hypothetical protein
MCARDVKPAPQPQPAVFVTQNTNAAAYFIATGQLRFCGARPNSGTNHYAAEFLFDDPDGVGLALLRSFKAGTAKPTEPRGLFEALGFLKSEVRRIVRARGAVANGR